MPKPKPGCIDAQLRNVDKEQWITFMHICKLEGMSATQKIKNFIHDTVVADRLLDKTIKNENNRN